MRKHKNDWKVSDWLALAIGFFVGLIVFLLIVLSAGCRRTTPVQVLLIGDSITREVARELDDPMYRFRLASQTWGSSRQVLAELPAIDTTCDIVYIRIGLHDTFKGISTEEYEYNMRAIVELLRQSSTRVILATLTPMPSQATKVARCNQRIIKIARDLTVELHDCRGMFQASDLRDEVHFTPAANKRLAASMLRQIKRKKR